MIKLMRGAETRLKNFKVPERVTNGVPIMCQRGIRWKLKT